MRSLFPLRIVEALRLDASGAVVEKFTHRLRFLAVLLYPFLRRDPDLLRLPASLLCRSGLVVIHYRMRGTSQVILFRARDWGPESGRSPPVTAEVRLSEAGARMDVTEIMRRLRGGTTTDCRPEDLRAYLSYSTGINVVDRVLTEVAIAPSAVGPRFVRHETELC